MDNDKLILMRGLPGSGKSTLAKKLAGENGVIYSTDDFFMKNGQYIYDSKMIVEYHNRNLQRAIQAMKKRISPIIIDNTNIKLWQMKRYVMEGERNGYVIEIREAQSQWAWDYNQCSKKNSHFVQREVIKKMAEGYQKFHGIQEIRNSQMPRRRKQKN